MSRDVTLYDPEESIEHDITINSYNLPSKGDVIMDMGKKFIIHGHRRRYEQDAEGEYNFKHILVGEYVEE